jgi:hypothetical protein
MAAEAHATNHETERLYDERYERFGKPLEAEHSGEYLAVSPRGDIIIGATLREVAQQAADAFGPGSFIYRIGESAVGKWR